MRPQKKRCTDRWGMSGIGWLCSPRTAQVDPITLSPRAPRASGWPHNFRDCHTIPKGEKQVRTQTDPNWGSGRPANTTRERLTKIWGSHPVAGMGFSFWIRREEWKGCTYGAEAKERESNEYTWQIVEKKMQAVGCGPVQELLRALKQMQIETKSEPEKSVEARF